jgi:adenylyl-sulfate kinase
MSSNSNALVVWFSGLSGAGKSTIGELARQRLEKEGLRVSIVDGDDIRRSTAKHLGFTPADIAEATRITLNICHERSANYDVLLVTRVSPLQAGRSNARKAFPDHFLEIYVKAQLATVRQRDPKKLYAKAAAGKNSPMIGTQGGTPFEEPTNAELTLDTDTRSAEELSLDLVTAVIQRRAQERA